MRRSGRVCSSVVALTIASVVVLIGTATVRGDGNAQALVVKCTVPCANVAAMVASVGGTLTYRYENIDAVAADVPPGAVAQLAALVGGDAIRKDVLTAPPRPAVQVTIDQASVAGVIPSSIDTDLPKFIQSLPQDFRFNNDIINASSVQAAGNAGQGVIVAVIDSGTANSPVVPALNGTVIGGESFVPAARDPVLSATSRLNGAHGTWVGTVIAAHALFGFSNTSDLVQSLEAHAPNSVLDPCPGAPAGIACIPMVGVAPAAKVYAMKVFPSDSNGAPASRIIAAMDRAITLRRNFNQGLSTSPVSGDGSEDHPFKYNALNIQVVNMSLGGPTLFAGQDLEDQLTLKMLDVGITVSVSAGNDGFAALTGGSPGTGLGALTVGAANTPAHERVLRDVEFGLGVGDRYRPNTTIQTAYFSSRGPTADGRFDPDVVANGFATFAQGTCAEYPQDLLALCAAGKLGGKIELVSGTSFSAPTAAGAAALVRVGTSGATATQVRNALAQSANPHLLGDASKRIDQGNGMLDVAAAVALAQSGTVSRNVPDLGRRDEEDADDEVGSGGESVAENIRRLGFKTIKFTNDTFSRRIRNLLPGQVAQLFVPSDDRTSRLVVTLSDVTPELAADQQNQLFGDDVFVNVADAPTSTFARRFADFVATDTVIPVDNPQTGLVRVALQGDWTNAGRISATVTITRERRADPRPTLASKVAQDDIVPITVDVPAGTKQLVFETSWKQNWGRYPTDDLDMVLVDPMNNVIEDGATLNSPERVEIANPTPGRWTALIIGFTINNPHGARAATDRDDDGETPREPFSFRSIADGVRLKTAK